MGDDAGDGRGAAGGLDPDGVAGTYGTRGDQTGETPEVEIGAVDPLDRHPERLGLQAVGIDLDRLQMIHQGRAGIPGRVCAGRGDVVAGDARDRDGDHVGHAQPLGEGGVIGDDLVEPGLIVSDKIHLVHRQDDVADAHQVDQETVPPRLGQDAFARIDQDDGEVGGRGAGDHVASILFVARGVGDNEFAAVGGEEPIGDVDGDALFPLGGQAVDQQGKVDGRPLGAYAFGIRLQLGQLVLKDHLGVIQQPPDQGGLAVVDRAAGDEPQQGLVLMRRQIGADIGGDQVGWSVHGRIGIEGHQK